MYDKIRVRNYERNCIMEAIAYFENHQGIKGVTVEQVGSYLDAMKNSPDISSVNLPQKMAKLTLKSSITGEMLILDAEKKTAFGNPVETQPPLARMRVSGMGYLYFRRGTWEQRAPEIKEFYRKLNHIISDVPETIAESLTEADKMQALNNPVMPGETYQKTVTQQTVTQTTVAEVKGKPAQITVADVKGKPDDHMIDQNKVQHNPDGTKDQIDVIAKLTPEKAVFLKKNLKAAYDAVLSGNKDPASIAKAMDMGFRSAYVLHLLTILKDSGLIYALVGKDGLLFYPADKDVLFELRHIEIVELGVRVKIIGSVF